MGTVSLSTDMPMVGMAITATLMDADTPISGEMWRWQKSMTMDGTFEDITDANSAMYTPAAGDEGYYLRAMVTYTDKYGGGNSAEATTGNAVTAEPVSEEDRLLADYDTNGTPGIQIDEVNTAIDDFFDGNLTLEEVNIVIDLFFM